MSEFEGSASQVWLEGILTLGFVYPLFAFLWARKAGNTEHCEVRFERKMEGETKRNELESLIEAIKGSNVRGLFCRGKEFFCSSFLSSSPLFDPSLLWICAMIAYSGYNIL